MKINYPAKNAVSIWVGNFPTEMEFDQFVDGVLAPLLRLPTHISAICEVTFEEEPKSIDELLHGFSGWQTFTPAATATAKAKRTPPANAAIICYYVDCVDAKDDWGKMTFIGTFNGHDQHE